MKDIKDIKAVGIDVITATYAQSIAETLVSVQPMSDSSGQIFSMPPHVPSDLSECSIEQLSDMIDSNIKYCTTELGEIEGLRSRGENKEAKQRKKSVDSIMRRVDKLKEHIRERLTEEIPINDLVNL